MSSFISGMSPFYNAPTEAFHHIGFFPLLFFLYTNQLYLHSSLLLQVHFIMWPFRCFVLYDCFPHQGHETNFKLVYTFFTTEGEQKSTFYHVPIQVCCLTIIFLQSGQSYSHLHLPCPFVPCISSYTRLICANICPLPNHPLQMYALSFHPENPKV